MPAVGQRTLSASILAFRPSRNRDAMSGAFADGDLRKDEDGAL
jgi:hypothetical protein